jgi:predicted alpha/beta hydrolase
MTEIVLKTSSGNQFRAYLYDSKLINDSCKRGHALPAVLISAATGVPAKFYHSYASFLASHGCIILTYDYEGIASSLALSGKTLEELSRTKNESNGIFGVRIIPNWVQDQNVCIAYLNSHYSDRELVVVAHSVGGHLIPMHTSITLDGSRSIKISRVLMVGVNTAYFGNTKASCRDKLIFNGLGPTIAYLFGYFPAKWMGLGEDLPMGVGIDWTTWGRRREYLSAYSKEATESYKSFDTNILHLCFSDDHLSCKSRIGWINIRQ